MDVLVPFHMLHADGVERLAVAGRTGGNRSTGKFGLWQSHFVLCESHSFPHTGKLSTIPLPGSSSIIRFPLDRSGQLYPWIAEAATQALAPVRPSLFPLSASSKISHFYSPVTRPLYPCTTRKVDVMVIQNQEYATLVVALAGVTFVYSVEVGSSKPELAMEISRGKCLVLCVAKMKEKLREMVLKRKKRQVSCMLVMYCCYPKSCRRRRCHRSAKMKRNLCIYLHNKGSH